MSDQGPPAERPDGQPGQPWQPGQPGEPPVNYPRQELLPQDIKPGRNRKPIFIGIGVALVLIIGGVAAYFVFRDDGEDNREAYCAALRDVTDNGDLTSALDGADSSTVSDLQEVVDLAPNAVSNEWKTLTDFVEDAQQSGEPDYGKALNAFTALREIRSDAESKCDLSLDIPMMP